MINPKLVTIFCGLMGLFDTIWLEERAMSANLSVYTFGGLRKHFGPYVEITRTTASLDWEAQLWLDAREIQDGVKLLKAGTASISPQVVQQMDATLRLYHGDFLAGFHVRGARNFDNWLSDQREHWRQVVLETAGGLISVYESMRSFKEGIELARWALQIDPLQESLHRQLMQLLALGG